jgi:aspartate/methionine/tyrosine aminotransferase
LCFARRERLRGDLGAKLRHLVLFEHVAVVPGIAFRTPEWIRVSYAAPAEQVLEGVRRIISARIS